MAKNLAQVLAITGGKGGVGKSVITVNLAIALAKQGKRVVLLDGDIGLANLNIMLGIFAEKNISHVLSGECSLRDIMVEGPYGLRLIPAPSGLDKSAQLNTNYYANVIEAMNEIKNEVDVLLIDTAAGINEGVLAFTCAAQEIGVVVTDDPASILDSYALIKLLNQHYQINRMRIITNMVEDQEAGEDLFLRLNAVAEQFLDVFLIHQAIFLFDKKVREAVKAQEPIMLLEPEGEFANTMADFAHDFTTWSIPEKETGRVAFFSEQVVENY